MIFIDEETNEEIDFYIGTPLALTILFASTTKGIIASNGNTYIKSNKPVIDGQIKGMEIIDSKMYIKRMSYVNRM